MGCDAVRSPMSSTGTTTSRSSSFARPASTSSIGRAPETKRPISSIGRWVADRPIRCTGPAAARSRRSRLRARCAPRFVPATACTSSTITVSTERSISRRLGGEQQVERLRRRDQDVRRLAQHRLALPRGRVAGADADAELRAQPCERPAQVALDVVVERLERRDVQEAQALARRRRQPVDAVEERRQRLPRARRRLDQHVPALGDRRPAERLCGRRRLEGALEPGTRRLAEHRC